MVGLLRVLRAAVRVRLPSPVGPVLLGRVARLFGLGLGLGGLVGRRLGCNLGVILDRLTHVCLLIPT